LLSPISKYGQSYDIWPFEDDFFKGYYLDLSFVKLKTDQDLMQINSVISQAGGYIGFES
jgi:hypothetical protein